MKTLYSSGFLAIVAAFLMMMGSQGKQVDLVASSTPLAFAGLSRPKPPLPSDTATVEIFDALACAGCSKLAKETLPKLRALEQESGAVQLRVYFVPKPEDEASRQAALALKCADEQGKFWGFHQRLHEDEKNANAKSMVAWAKELGADDKLFKACVESKKFQSTVEADGRHASEKGVTARPSLWVNEYEFEGTPPFENIERRIRQILPAKENREGAMPESPATDLEEELEKAFELSP